MIYCRFIDKKEHFDTSQQSYHSYQHKCAVELLCDCIKREYSLYIDEKEISKKKNGKPYFLKYPDIHFNISHTDGLVCCVLSENECGIDCERIKNVHFLSMKRLFSASEIDFVSDNAEKFCRIWTLKESFGKATGNGITDSLKNLSFDISDYNEINCNLTEYSFYQFIIDSYVVSSCFNSKMPSQNYVII